MKAATKRRWRNRLIFVLVVALGIGAYMLYLNSFTIYSYAHLTPELNLGESTEFVPLGGTDVPGMVQAAQSGHLALYVDMNTSAIAVFDSRNGHAWHSSPPGTNTDPIATPFERGNMRSNFGFRYFCFHQIRRWNWGYNDSANNRQFEIYSIPGGIRVHYLIGDVELGIEALPLFIEAERFEQRIIGYLDEDYVAWMRRQFTVSRVHEDEDEVFMQMLAATRTSAINSARILELFDAIGYTLEELYYDNTRAGVEFDVDFDTFELVMEFVLEDDTLVVNVPLDQFSSNLDTNLLERMDLMKFFGAGGPEEEGYLFVPSGSGALIAFNNGKNREAPFISRVYGTDMNMAERRTQVEQPIRLPVLGIIKDDAAMIAHVVNGAGLASVNAEIAGRLSAHNFVWFSFAFRESNTMLMTGVPESELNFTDDSVTVIQRDAFEGDITIRYHFLAGEDANIAGMAATYQGYLVEAGVLTPLTGQQDRSFYLDIIGAANMRRSLLGHHYNSFQVMTSVDEAYRIVGLFNDMGVNTIQMQLHGWFNRGVNHHVARNVNLIRGVGNRNSLHNLNNRLEQHGGGLFPGVNFHLTNMYQRTLNTSYEVVRCPVGWWRPISTVSRSNHSLRGSAHWEDWYHLVHPRVIPFHVSDFIENYSRRVGLNNLALLDMGDFLTQDMSRRNFVDREHSRLIARSQMERLQSEFSNIMITGGNDFSLGVASHLVDVPTAADMFYLIDYEVPFFQMVVHGFIEFAGSPVNLQDAFNPQRALLNTIATGASPRFLLTAEPTRLFYFSANEQFYTTHYIHWIDLAAEHYRIFNEVHRDLRTERITGFEILHNEPRFLGGTQQVTVTEFSNGTRIYANNTRNTHEVNGIYLEPYGFHVVR